VDRGHANNQYLSQGSQCTAWEKNKKTCNNKTEKGKPARRKSPLSLMIAPVISQEMLPGPAAW
jgi:hypothetical protein